MQASAKTAIARGRRAEERGAGGGFVTLYQKELADHFRSARFKLLFALLTLTSLASLFGAFDSLMSSQTSEYVFLSMYTASGSSIPRSLRFWPIWLRWWGWRWALTPSTASARRAR